VARFDWRSQPYVSAAEKRARAEREGRSRGGLAPVRITTSGRAIAATFWGKAWCDNLERYSDLANRLPRGRTYVRSGAVIDLRVEPGVVRALVSGSMVYDVEVTIAAVTPPRWAAIRGDCAGAIDSLVELLQGRLSARVMERICQRETGLFPAPPEIDFTCSCPDSAYMCKHVAAVLYGVGARLDAEPKLLFGLRGVDEQELITGAAAALPSASAPPAGRILAGADLGALFGLELMAGVAPEPARTRPRAAPKKQKPAPKTKRPASKKKPAATRPRR